MLINKINSLKKSEIKKQVDKRINEFEINRTVDEIFSELCFCLLTANFNAERSIKIQNEIGVNGFLNLPEKKLVEKLKELGHRFYNKRAEYIVEARKQIGKIFAVIKQEKEKKTNKKTESLEIRTWLIGNIKGLGLKEASHFLRNIGFKDFAIIDFHIVDLLVKEGLIGKQKRGALTQKKYLDIEQILFGISKKVNLNLAELDLYLWYLETGKILK